MDQSPVRLGRGGTVYNQSEKRHEFRRNKGEPKYDSKTPPGSSTLDTLYLQVPIDVVVRNRDGFIVGHRALSAT